MDVSGTFGVRTEGKVLYIITKATWGGAQRYVFDLAREAAGRGYETIVAGGTAGELAERLSVEGIPLVGIPGLGRDVRLFHDIRAWWALGGIIRKERPAIIHANSSKAGFSTALALFFSGTRARTVFTAHGWAYDENRNLFAKFGIALLHYFTVLVFSRTICVSEGTRRGARWMPFVQKKLIVIRNGIEPTSLYSREYSRMTLAPSIKSKFWIGALAELHKVKGLDVLIQAFSEIARDFPDTVLALFGEGDERAALEALVRDGGLEGRVRFFGHVKDGGAYLSAFDVFVQPSRSEALGYALIEAGHAKLPVVATKVGGIPEIVKDGESGILVPPGDTLQLRAALIRLLQNDALRAKLGEALHARVAQDFSRERMVEETFALYR